MGFIVRKRRAATLIEINIAPVRGRTELNRASVSITQLMRTNGYRRRRSYALSLGRGATGAATPRGC